MAIHTDPLPRIHYYSLFSSDKSGRRHSLLQKTILHRPRDPEHKLEPLGPRLRFRTAFPCVLCPHAEDYSWAKSHCFRYIWDAGLRTACRESRLVVLRHLKRQAANPQQMSVALARHNEEDVQFRVNSRSDALCLEFTPEDIEACRDLRWDVLLARIPFYRQQRIRTINIAFEFHDSWNANMPETPFDLLHEGSPRGLVMRDFWAWTNGELPNQTTIWLIDRGWRPPRGYYKWYNDTECHRVLFADEKERYQECHPWNWFNDEATRVRRAVIFARKLAVWHEKFTIRSEQTRRFGLPSFYDPCIKVLCTADSEPRP